MTRQAVEPGRINNSHVADSTPAEMLASLDRLVERYSTDRYPEIVAVLLDAGRDLEQRQKEEGS